MTSNPRIISGVVKNGVVVPDGKAELPEGTRVEIIVPVIEITSELQAEVNASDKTSDEASKTIDHWEREE